MTLTDPSLPDRIEAWLDPLPTCVLLAALQLDLFTLLARRPSSAAALAAQVGGDSRRLTSLLRALAAMGLVHELAAGAADSRFAVDADAARLLNADSDDFIGLDHQLMPRFMGAGLRIAATIRSGQPQAGDLVGHTTAQQLRGFLKDLHPGCLALGKELARRGWLAGCDRIVDVGGGSGGVAAAVVAATRAKVTIVEQGDVVGVTRQMLDDDGCNHIDIIVGDVTDPDPGPEQELSPPFDAALCIALLQVLGPESAARVVARVAGWLRPGGLLLVTGMGIIDDDRRTPTAAALGDTLLSTLYEEGRVHTVGDIRAWMEAADLVDICVDHLDDGRRVMRGWRRR